MLDPFQGACISCKKRRIKCDFAKPCCNRCRKSGIECPGYVKIRQWRKSKPGAPAAQKAIIDSKVNDVSAHSSKLVSPETSTSGSEISDLDPYVQYIPKWLLSSSPEKDEPLVFDCIQCLNKRHLPTRLLPQPPFNRRRHEVVYCPSMPKLLQKLFVVIVRTAEAINNDLDPRSDVIISHYRSKGLQELKILIEGAVLESHGFTLSGIIFFMLADLGQLEHLPSGAWVYHLEAARRVILLRGGLLHCFRSLRDIRPLLCNFMLIDIHAATVSHSLLLKRSLESHKDYVDVLANAEEIYDRGFLFRPVLGDIVDTTRLRMSRKSGSVPFKDFGAIRQSLESFDALAWINRVTTSGRPHPLKPGDSPSAEIMAAWLAFAVTYKSAALLYLLLSCSDVSKDSDQIIGAKRTLDASIHYLTNTGSSRFDAPIEAQIWRLLDWPVLISTYIRTGWGIGEESTETEVKRLDWLLKETNRKGVAAGFTKRALVKRWQDPDKIWDWDDGLDSRSPFYLA